MIGSKLIRMITITALFTGLTVSVIDASAGGVLLLVSLLAFIISSKEESKWTFVEGRSFIFVLLLSLLLVLYSLLQSPVLIRPVAALVMAGCLAAAYSVISKENAL